MLRQRIKLLAIVVIILCSQLLFCKAARKVRYHKARNIERKASAQFLFGFDGTSDGEIGDVFGFLSYYRPEDDIDLLNIDEDFRNGAQENEDEIRELYFDPLQEQLLDPRPTTGPKQLNVCFTFDRFLFIFISRIIIYL